MIPLLQLIFLLPLLLLKPLLPLLPFYLISPLIIHLLPDFPLHTLLFILLRQKHLLSQFITRILTTFHILLLNQIQILLPFLLLLLILIR